MNQSTNQSDCNFNEVVLAPPGSGRSYSFFDRGESFEKLMRAGRKTNAAGFKPETLPHYRQITKTTARKAMRGYR